MKWETNINLQAIISICTMHLLRHRLALIRTVGDLNAEVARIARNFNLIVITALIAVLLLTTLQILTIVSSNSVLDSETTLALLETRTVLLVILLSLFLIVMAQLRGELRRLDSSGFKKELRVIRVQ